jgi:hypothetical protein
MVASNVGAAIAGYKKPATTSTKKKTTPKSGGATIYTSKAPVTKGGGKNQFMNWTWPEPSMDYAAMLQSAVQPEGAPVSAPFGPSGGNNGGGGRGHGGGGGGAPAGPTPEQVRQWASELYTFNAAPYDQMRANVEGQRQQALGYNPDFAGMQAGYDQRLNANEADRANMVKQRLQNLVTMGSQLAGQQGQALSGAVRDLTAQGINPSTYVDQANRMGAERTGALANQTQYQGQLDVNAAQQLADFRNAGNLVRQGGETSLANNRGTLLNTLQQNASNIGLQQAQAQQANDQARREFLIKYGVT